MTDKLPEVNVNKSKSGLEVFLHPLVLNNISDSYTRAKFQSTGDVPRCIGALFGTQEGRKVILRTSFEMIYKMENNELIIDMDYVKEKLEQYVQVYKNYEILGWYSTGPGIIVGDEKIHRQLMDSGLNDSPLYMTCDCDIDDSVKELPITMAEAKMADDESIEWVSLGYAIETEISEHISVEEVSKGSGNEGENSQLAPQFAKMGQAVDMLNDHTHILINYLEAVKKNQVPKNHSLLRAIHGLTFQIPAIDSNKFRKDYANEQMDVKMVTQLASMTKGCQQLNELVEKYNVAYQKRGHGHMFY